MKLRLLESKDAPFMLEWMQDEEITSHFQTDFKSMTIDRVQEFIEVCQDISEHCHMAIVDDKDEYLGTISLKNISKVHKNAEYAVCLRKKAIGTAVAMEGTKAIIEFAFNELQLHRVYLNVYEDNVRANKFYKKFGFKFEGTSKDALYIQGEYKSLNWYAIVRE